MDGFTGFKSAAVEHLPDAVEVRDPFHVVQLAGDALDRCRQRVQQETTGHRGRSGDPLYAARRTLHTGEALLTDSNDDDSGAVRRRPVQVEATWGVYQHVVAAYRDPDKQAGRTRLKKVIDAISRPPGDLTELVTLGRTLKKRATDVLAYFDHPGTSNGPTEAINGRLGLLHG